MSNLTSSTASPNQQCTSFASPAAAAAAKKKRNLPGNPDPDAEVIALSPRTLMATNRFVCEVCKKGFQRDQNLQLHRRGHNLPWKLKQRPTATNSKDGSAAAAAAVRKKVYVCPEGSCVHHSPSRALGDLTGIKKHFSRKHGEKKYKCDKCSKKYAVHSDWKAHSKTCGTREYTCDCGTIFSRRDSFITHRAFCDALAEENAKSNPLFSSSSTLLLPNVGTTPPQEQQQQQQHFNNNAWLPTSPTSNVYSSSAAHDESRSSAPLPLPLPLPHLGSSYRASPHLSATALLQKAAQMGATTSCRPGHSMAARSAGSPLLQEPVMPMPMPMTRRNGEGGGGGGGDGLTRDFLGLRALSHKDMILSMAAAGLPCMGSSSSSFQHCQDQHY